MSKTSELEARLGEERPLSDFNRDWINNSSNSKEEMWQIYCILRYKGFSHDKIASRAELLGMNPETIDRNYQNHVGLLRQNFEDRNSGRELIFNQAQLLGIPPKTIESNVQYLDSLGIDYNNGLLLGTTTKLKRKKMAWLLREIFDYRKSEDKNQTIYKMREFVKSNPSYLVKSIPALEKAKPRIIQKLAT